GHMGLFFYNKIGSIISIRDLPTTNIIEPESLTQSFLFLVLESFYNQLIK
ncbi:AraC family transcriptional regulator, partial [Streptococcus pneumoniae]